MKFSFFYFPLNNTIFNSLKCGLILRLNPLLDWILCKKYEEGYNEPIYLLYCASLDSTFSHFLAANLKRTPFRTSSTHFLNRDAY